MTIRRRTIARRSARGRRFLVAACVTTSAACSGGDGTVLPPVDTDGVDVDVESTDGVAPATDVAFAPIGRWGDGRALAVEVTGTMTAIVTTTAVFTQPAGASLDAVVERTDPASGVLAELDPFGEELAIAAGDKVSMVALASGAERDIALPIGAAPSQLVFGPTGLVVNTSDGAFVVPPGAAEASPLATDVAAFGRIADLGERLVAPVQGTPDVIVVDEDGESRRLTLDLAPGALVLDAQASMSGVVGVSSGVGPDEFERTDQLNLVDPGDGRVTAVIDVGEMVEPASWTVTGASVALATEGRFRAWALDGSELVDAPSPSQATVWSVVEVDGAVVVNHTDGSVVRWDATEWTPVLVSPGGTTPVDVDVAPDGTMLASVDYFGRVASRPSTADMTGTELLRFATGEATDVAVADDGRIAVSTTTGDAVLLGPDLHQTARVRLTAGASRVGAVAFDEGSDTLLTGLEQRVGEFAYDDTVVGWDPELADERYRLGGDGLDVAGCAFFYNRIRVSPDGTMMAVTSHDFSVVLADPATGAELHVIEGPASVLDVAFSADGAELVVSYDDATTTVRRLDDVAVVAGTLATTMGGYHALAPLPDGDLVVADVTGEVTVVERETGQLVRALGNAGLRTTVLATSPDGSLVASPGADSSIIVWSTTDGGELARLAGHTGEVTGLAFSSDGTMLASSSSDGTARTWRVGA